MIEIPLTAEQFEARARQLKAQQGIELSGPEGIISKPGVKARYLYQNGVLGVEILEKPFFVSTAYCEEQLLSFLK